MEKKIKPTDSAYPTHGCYSDGMDIRSKFALEFTKIYANMFTTMTPKEEIAKMGVDMADNLIEQLNKK